MSFKEILTERTKKAFKEAGYDEEYGIVTVSNRPDLCMYQCNGCMPLAKKYRKNPVEIAKEIASVLERDGAFKRVTPCPPGFLNMDPDDGFLTDYINLMREDENLLDSVEVNKTAIVDYGGANVAKSLHVGHLRSAIIGESVKRILKKNGYNALGDVHLGDWGLQMGMVISGIVEKFGIENLMTEEDRERLITIKVLETTYPEKSAQAKADKEVMEQCHKVTCLLQTGEGIYFDIWKTVLKVSVADLKRNYERLLVNFELWKGESDVRDIIPGMVEDLKKKGIAREDQGCIVVDITDERDNPPLPPFILLKSDGAALYDTTDLATILMRNEDFDPDLIVYVVDNRQSTHFKQLFRAAEKTGIKKEKTTLSFAGFGTMNGKDGKPYKTRDGGVMKLEDLINTLESEAYEKTREALSEDIGEEERRRIARQVGIGALKFADLSNHRSKDYVFDIDKFCSFEGKTGPYIQYSAVRAKAVLNKAEIPKSGKINPPEGDIQRELFVFLADHSEAYKTAFSDFSPNVIAEYAYKLAALMNRYYHEYKVLSEEDENVRNSRILTLSLSLRVLKEMLDILAIEIPDRM